MYIGIDFGTSWLKAIVMNEDGIVLASHSESLPISRPHTLWSEQNPEDWRQATERAIQILSKKHQLQDVKAIGIAGQITAICQRLGWKNALFWTQPHINITSKSAKPFLKFINDSRR